MAKQETKAPAKKAAAKTDDGQIWAYNVRAKEKQVMHNAVISKTTRGGFMASGTSEDGETKLTTILSAANAEKFVESGVAKKDKKTWK
jgi:hypothetical protein